MEDNNYTTEIQELFLRFIVSDPELFVRVNTIVEPYMFDKKFQKAITFLQEHTTEYNAIPTIDQIEATTGLLLERVNGISELGDHVIDGLTSEWSECIQEDTDSQSGKSLVLHLLGNSRQKLGSLSTSINAWISLSAQS